MSSRRTFLKRTAVLTAATAGLAGSGSGRAGTPAPEDVTATELGPDAPGNVASRRVPDTLDLADRGRLALRGMLGSLDPALDYECYFLAFFDVHPAYAVHWSSMVSGVMPKFVEALPLLRLMTGRSDHLDLQNGFMEAMLRNAAEDGLVYDRARPDRPWNTGVGYGVKHWDEDYANMAGNGRFLQGLTFWHQWMGEPKWKALAKKTAERLLELAVVRDDIAYYPNPGLGNDFSYPRRTGWTHTKSPDRPDEGYESSTLFYLLNPVRGFTRYYALTGDRRFLELSRKFVNLGMQPQFWGAKHDMHPAMGAERGHFQIHFHGNLAAIRAILDYALVANDSRLKLFVRDAYDWSRQQGLHRLGIFPNDRGMMDGCVISDMVGLAVALTDAGLGDYWDDVEQYARNGLAEAQATDRNEMVRVSEAGKARPQDSPWARIDYRFISGNKGTLKGQECTDRVIDRMIGGFGPIQGARNLVILEGCCNGNGPQALYHAWEAIVRHRGGDTAEVNLWLNRRSPWCDVWSWLPFAGKLVVQNKGMRQLAIRVPSWARPRSVRCRVDGREADPVRLGNRWLLSGLRGREQIEVDAPLAIEKTEYGMVDLNQRDKILETHVCEFKGHTAVRVTPVAPLQDPLEYRLFRRDAMRGEAVPMKQADEYVHPSKLVQWMVL